MALTILAVIAATGGGLGLARILDSFSAPPPDDTGEEPKVWGPGEAPMAPWKADEERSATGSDVYVDCLPGGKRGMDANAVFARWLNHEKGMPLPGNIHRMSRNALAKKLAVTALASTIGKNPARATALWAEWDVIAYGCMGKEAWEQIKRGPGKIGSWIKDRVGDGSGGASIGNDNNGVEIGSDGHGSVSVGGKKIVSW